MKIAPRNSRLQNLLAFSARCELRLFVFQALYTASVRQAIMEIKKMQVIITVTSPDASYHQIMVMMVP